VLGGGLCVGLNNRERCLGCVLNAFELSFFSAESVCPPSPRYSEACHSRATLHPFFARCVEIRFPWRFAFPQFPYASVTFGFKIRRVSAFSLEVVPSPSCIDGAASFSSLVHACRNLAFSRIPACVPSRNAIIAFSELLFFFLRSDIHPAIPPYTDYVSGTDFHSCYFRCPLFACRTCGF